MPSLLRFLFVIAVLGGLGYGAMYSLATFIDPQPRQITVTIPHDKLMKHR